MKTNNGTMVREVFYNFFYSFLLNVYFNAYLFGTRHSLLLGSMIMNPGHFDKIRVLQDWNRVPLPEHLDLL